MALSWLGSQVHQDLYTALWLKTKVFAAPEARAAYVSAVENAVRNARKLTAELHSGAVGAGPDDEGPGGRSVQGFVEPALLRCVRCSQSST